MTKLVVIIGATGKQGGSVVNAFLRDSSSKVRTLTRDPSSAAAKALKTKGVEVIQRDTSDRASLQLAFKGANVIFCDDWRYVSTRRRPCFHGLKDASGVNGRVIAETEDVASIVEEAYKIEKASGQNIVDAVSKTLDNLNLFIFSSLSVSTKLSNGKYNRIYHFDAKFETVEYLESAYPELVDKTVTSQMGMFATISMRPTPLRPTKVSNLLLVSINI